MIKCTWQHHQPLVYSNCLWFIWRKHSRENKDGWPLLIVEIEANGTYGVQMKGVLRWLVRWPHRAGTRDCYPALVALVNPVHFFFLEAYFLILWVPIGQKSGQAVVPGCLSFDMFLLKHLWIKITNSAKTTAIMILLMKYAVGCAEVESTLIAYLTSTVI